MTDKFNSLYLYCMFNTIIFEVLVEVKLVDISVNNTINYNGGRDCTVSPLYRSGGVFNTGIVC